MKATVVSRNGCQYRRDVYPAMCEECGSGFDGYKPTARFCSRECLAASMRWPKRRTPGFVVAFCARCDGDYLRQPGQSEFCRRRECREERWATSHGYLAVLLAARASRELDDLVTAQQYEDRFESASVPRSKVGTLFEHFLADDPSGGYW